MQAIEDYIEHTNLSPLVTSEEIEQLVKEAKACNFYGLCVPPYWAKKARREIGEAPISLVTVIGFPLGFHRSEVKIQEVKSALREGVNEFDVMVNLSAIKNGAYHWVKIEMSQIATLVHEQERLLKVIIETAYLDEEEIRQVCKVCVDAGVDFIKTSSGYASQGAQLDKVKLLREILPSQVGLKASGGINSFASAKAFIEAGADRIGTSSGFKIFQEFQASKSS